MVSKLKGHYNIVYTGTNGMYIVTMGMYLYIIILAVNDKLLLIPICKQFMITIFITLHVFISLNNATS